MSFDDSTYFFISTDQLLLTFLAYLFKPLREFCVFSKVPDASKVIRFNQDFINSILLVFDNFVDFTELICQSINSVKADMTIFDSSDIESFVTENNPNYANRIIKQLKVYTKANNIDKIMVLTMLLIVLYQHMYPQISKLNSYTLMGILAMSTSLILL